MTALNDHQAAVPEQLYEVRDVVKILSLGRSVIYELIRSGRLGSVKEGRSRRIPESALAEYVALLKREAKGEAA